MLKNVNLTSIALLLGMVALLDSCVPEDSVDVNQDRIYADYELFYNSNTDKTWVVARFKFGNALGTALELKEDAFVTFNGDTLPYNAFYAGHFKEYAGYIHSGSFFYRDHNANVFENTIPAVDTIAIPPTLDTIAKSSAYTLSWVGSPLAADEAVGVFIGSNWIWGQDALLYQDGDGATNIVIGTNVLNNVAVGPATCYMDRSKEVNLTEGTSAGGRIRQKFRAKNKSLYVKN